MISEVDLILARTVSDYSEGGPERGAALIARRLGRNQGYFANKVNPEYSDAHLTITALLEIVLHLHEEIGETEGTLRKALADGKITRKEFQAIDSELREDISVMFERRARLDGLVVDQ